MSVIQAPQKTCSSSRFPKCLPIRKSARPRVLRFTWMRFPRGRLDLMELSLEWWVWGSFKIQFTSGSSGLVVVFWISPTYVKALKKGPNAWIIFLYMIPTVSWHPLRLFVWYGGIIFCHCGQNRWNLLCFSGSLGVEQALSLLANFISRKPSDILVIWKV